MTQPAPSSIVRFALEQLAEKPTGTDRQTREYGASQVHPAPFHSIQSDGLWTLYFSLQGDVHYLLVEVLTVDGELALGDVYPSPRNRVSFSILTADLSLEQLVQAAGCPPDKSQTHPRALLGGILVEGKAASLTYLPSVPDCLVAEDQIETILDRLEPHARTLRALTANAELCLGIYGEYPPGAQYGLTLEPKTIHRLEALGASFDVQVVLS